MNKKAHEQATADPQVLISASTLKHWLELVTLNPQDLTPRIQSYIAKAADGEEADCRTRAARKGSASMADPDSYLTIDHDDEMQRHYIPMPGGWEIQTKGKGSTFRLCDPHGERLAIPDSPYLWEELTAMARDANASWKRLEARVSHTGWASRVAHIARGLLTELEGLDAKAEPHRSGNTLGHVLWMLNTLSGEPYAMSDTKACRWIGYVQGWLVANRHTTLDIEKQRNVTSVNAPGFQPTSPHAQITKLCADIQAWLDGPSSDVDAKDREEFDGFLARIRSLHISTLHDERSVQLMARYIAGQCGENFDDLGEFMQHQLLDTQRNALEHARAGRHAPQEGPLALKALIALMASREAG